METFLSYAEFLGGGGSTLVALLVAKLLYNKLFTNGKSDDTKTLMETRFSQQHEDLKAIKAVAYSIQTLTQWLKDAHDRRDGDGAFVWWNKSSIEDKVREIDGRLTTTIALLESRALDATQSKKDIIAAVDRIDRGHVDRPGGG